MRFQGLFDVCLSDIPKHGKERGVGTKCKAKKSETASIETRSSHSFRSDDDFLTSFVLLIPKNDKIGSKV